MNLYLEFFYILVFYGIWGVVVVFLFYFLLGNMELDGEILFINIFYNFINLLVFKENDRNDLCIFGKLIIILFKDLKIIGEYIFNRKIREIIIFDKKFVYVYGVNFCKE